MRGRLPTSRGKVFDDFVPQRRNKSVSISMDKPHEWEVSLHSHSSSFSYLLSIQIFKSCAQVAESRKVFLLSIPLIDIVQTTNHLTLACGKLSFLIISSQN